MQIFSNAAIETINRIVRVAVVFSVLSGCVSREAVEQAPHVNLSAEDLALESMETDSADIGLSVALNESDSLMDLAVLPGLRVRRVDSGSLADLAGIRSGDVILSVNDIETNQADTLHQVLAVSGDDPERDFKFVVRRDTALLEMVLLVSSATQSIPQEIARVDPVKTRAAYRLESKGDGTLGLRVIAIFKDSPLRESKISQGELIVAVEGQPISSAQAFVDQMLGQSEFGERVTLSVQTAGEPMQAPRLVDITLWQPRKKVTGVKLWPLFTYSASVDGSEMRWSVLDFWLVWLFAYEREESEQSVNLLRLLEFSTGYGELTEE